MSAAPAIKIVVVDTQAIFRAGIRQICSDFPNLEVVGETSRGPDTLVLCERLRPNLLLLEAALPGALSLIAQLREHHGGLGIVLLADRVDEHLLRRGLQLGIVGYLLKQIDPFDLVQALRGAAGGLLSLAPEVAAALACVGQPECDHETLSDREQGVLALLLQGLSNESIAARLRVSCSTVKFHLRNIYGKLGVSSRAEALATIYGQRRAPAGRPGDGPTELPRRRAVAVAV